MKNCEEMVHSLLTRREQYAAAQKRKKAALIRAAIPVGCVCLAALVGVGLWKGGVLNTAPPEIAGDSVNIGEKDYSGPDESRIDPDGQSSADSDTLHGGMDRFHSAGDPNTGNPNEGQKTMISSFDGNDGNGTPSASYVTPENGKQGFSTPLQKAMDAYGDRVLYRVVVDVFRDREPLSADSKPVQQERARLADNGYTVAYETVFDGESYHHYFTLHASYEELTGFAANENYGYFLFLYDERVEPAANSAAGYAGTER